MKNRPTPEKALRLRKRVYLAILILLVFATFSYFFSDVSRTESHVEGTQAEIRPQGKKKDCSCCARLSRFKKEFEARKAKRKAEQARRAEKSAP